MEYELCETTVNTYIRPESLSLRLHWCKSESYLVFLARVQKMMFCGL